MGTIRTYVPVSANGFSLANTPIQRALKSASLELSFTNLVGGSAHLIRPAGFERGMLGVNLYNVGPNPVYYRFEKDAVVGDPSAIDGYMVAFRTHFTAILDGENYLAAIAVGAAASTIRVEFFNLDL